MAVFKQAIVDLANKNEKVREEASHFLFTPNEMKCLWGGVIGLEGESLEEWIGKEVNRISVGRSGRSISH